MSGVGALFQRSFGAIKGHTSNYSVISKKYPHHPFTSDVDTCVVPFHSLPKRQYVSNCFCGDLCQSQFYYLIYGSIETFYVLTTRSSEVGSATATALDELGSFANEVASVETLISNEIL